MTNNTDPAPVTEQPAPPPESSTDRIARELRMGLRGGRDPLKRYEQLPLNDQVRAIRNGW